MLVRPAIPLMDVTLATERINTAFEACYATLSPKRNYPGLVRPVLDSKYLPSEYLND